MVFDVEPNVFFLSFSRPYSSQNVLNLSPVVRSLFGNRITENGVTVAECSELTARSRVRFPGSQRYFSLKDDVRSRVLVGHKLPPSHFGNYTRFGYQRTMFDTPTCVRVIGTPRGGGKARQLVAPAFYDLRDKK